MSRPATILNGFSKLQFQIYGLACLLRQIDYDCICFFLFFSCGIEIVGKSTNQVIGSSDAERRTLLVLSMI